MRSMLLSGVLAVALAGCTAAPPAPTPTAIRPTAPPTAGATRPTIAAWHALVYHARPRPAPG
ncbi:MAG: hypothetical protein ACM30G_11715 [Micromonosporaceae bacterium]